VNLNKVHGTFRLALLIPIALSAFTHLWNPTGFPDIFYDEGVYMRRAMHVLEGFGPQEANFYDHPYFGQIFLAAFLGATGYPGSTDPSSTPHSIEALYAVPRILMGCLAVVDTFLVYKISEKRYGRKVALFSSILFAVMPITWLTRRILLDSILLPFLLASMLFATYASSARGIKKCAWVLMAGVLLGIAIFTKIPILILVPVVSYLVFSGSQGCRLRVGALFFIPLVSITMIWPAYSVSSGTFDLWLKDVVWQTQRQSAGFESIVYTFFLYDPVLLLFSAVGFVLAGIKKDFFLLLWIVPFLVFLFVIGYVQYFYWIPVLPVFCIASARLIDRLVEVNQKLASTIITGLGIFGLVSTSLLVTINITSAQFEAAAFAADYSDDETTIVSSPTYSWIFIYVFDKEHSLSDYRDLLFHPVETKKMLIISDQHFQSNIGAGKQLQDAYDNTKIVTAFEGEVLNYDTSSYPFTNLAANFEGSRVEIRAN
jgi:dolichyl-phosphate-mannose-protein mannosyltransferase